MNNGLQMAAEEVTVLVVSSHGHLRSHYASVLAPLNATILTVTDGFEALDLLRSCKITSILSDFDIPGMDGVELFLRTKELLFNVPFVICSSNINARAREEALKVGVMRVISKPTNRREICEVVAEAIEERQRQILQFFC